jgi:hypothetical protein
MRKLSLASLLFLLVVTPVFGEVSFYVPVVTQLQGVVFYRTSLAAVNTGLPTHLFLVFRYRSPADNSFQTATYIVPVDIPTDGVFAADDIIGYLKGKSAIRAADQGAALFGTLEVQFFGSIVSDRANFSVIARTYSPGAGNSGTVGISYAGNAIGQQSSFRGLITTLRNGSFGADGNTRANIGFVNVTSGTNDVRIRYIDAENDHVLKDFLLSSVIGRSLAGLEVMQLSNIFLDPALAGVSRITLIATPTGGVMTGYVVQLDNTTNDGSFYLMTAQ